MFTIQQRIRRAQLHSRRGMLELDLLFFPFSIEFLPQHHEVLEAFEKLLEEQDQDLYTMFFSESPPHHQHQPLLAVIQDYAKNHQGF